MTDQTALFEIDAEADEALREQVYARRTQLIRRVDAIKARCAREIAPLEDEIVRLFQQYENITARLQGREPRDLFAPSEDDDDRHCSSSPDGGTLST